MNLVSARQAILKTVSDAVADRFDRSLLESGSSYKIEAEVAIEGTIDSKPFATVIPVDATITTGHDTTRASSVTPSPESQLAYVLELIELAYGSDAVGDIVADLLKKYDESKSIPASEKYAEIVASMSRRMREIRSQDVKGSVKVKDAAAAENISLNVEQVA